jgi:toxin ParE1/3/4
MKQRELVIDDEVSAELEAATTWYEREREGLGLDLAREVRAVYQHLAGARRGIGVVVPALPKRSPVRRLFLTSFPYAIVFVVTDDVVHILAVAHLKRVPDYWRPRLRRLARAAPPKRR